MTSEDIKHQLNNNNNINLEWTAKKVNEIIHYDCSCNLVILHQKKVNNIISVKKQEHIEFVVRL